MSEQHTEEKLGKHRLWTRRSKRKNGLFRRIAAAVAALALTMGTMPAYAVSPSETTAPTGKKDRNILQAEKVLARWSALPDEKLQKELQRVSQEVSKNNILLYQRLARLRELTHDLSFLSERFAGLEEDSAEQWKMIQLVAGQDERLRLEAKKIIEKDQDAQSGLPPLQDISLSADSIEKLPGVLAKLQSVKDERMNVWRVLEKSNGRLHEIRHEFYRDWLVKSDRPQSPGAIIAQWRKQRDELKDREAQLAEREEELKQLTIEMETLRSELNNWQDVMSKSDEKVGQMTRDLAAASLELFEKDRQLKDRENQLTEFRTRIREYEERISLSQKILTEKESVIEKLRQEIDLAAGLVNEGLEGAIEDRLNETPANAAVASGDEAPAVITDQQLQDRSASPETSVQEANEAEVLPVSNDEAEKQPAQPSDDIVVNDDRAAAPPEVPVASERALFFDTDAQQPAPLLIPDDILPAIQHDSDILQQLHTRKLETIFAAPGAWSTYLSQPFRPLNSITSEVND